VTGRRLALVGLFACLATACSEGGGSSPADQEPSGSPLPVPTETVTLTPSLDPELAAASDLAAVAESLAGEVPTTVPIQPRDEPVLGADISWPQCPPGMGIEHKETSGQPLPTAEAEYVVIGLTNGPGFHANPCLADQVAWTKQQGLLLSAYSVISWPDDAAQAQYGGLHEAGYAQAQFNLKSMESAGLDTPIIWLDVEQVPHYEWSADTAANAEVVLGAAQGYLDAGYRIGVYSTPYIWESLVGDLALGVPEWRAAGQTSRAEAESRCGRDWVIQGGEAVLGQWVQDGRDKNVTCPGIEADLGRWFALG
jgi:hypothetical protein